MEVGLDLARWGMIGRDGAVAFAQCFESSVEVGGQCGPALTNEVRCCALREFLAYQRYVTEHSCKPGAESWLTLDNDTKALWIPQEDRQIHILN